VERRRDSRQQSLEEPINPDNGASHGQRQHGDVTWDNIDEVTPSMAGRILHSLYFSSCTPYSPVLLLYYSTPVLLYSRTPAQRRERERERERVIDREHGKREKRETYSSYSG
jgi:hypothetical protein